MRSTSKKSSSCSADRQRGFGAAIPDVFHELTRALAPSEVQRMLARLVAWDRQRGEARLAQILVERARATVADDVERAGDGKGGDRQAARHRFDQDYPQRIAARGKK